MAGFQLRQLFACTLTTLSVSSLTALPVQADITLDGTLGPSGPLTGPNYEIPATDGEQVGSNLFHSFGVFSINTGESATFTGPNGIENVLGRVTGGESSNIDGELNSDIPGANLYLINPSGIMFGPNAQLNVDGSFHASTADYIRLGQDGMFSARNPETSTLTVAPPSAFGFLDDNPAPISMNGSNLAVPPGKTFSIVGGNINIAGGSVAAPSGRINLASIASPGEVKVGGGSLNVDSIPRLGEIKISQGANVDASGDGGGSIFIRGGNLTVDNSLVRANTLGNLDGGGVSINLTGDLVASNGTAVQAITLAGGSAGNIAIRAENLTLTSGTQIDSSSRPEGDIQAGNAGDLTITASGLVMVSGQNNESQSGLFSNTFGGGDAGHLSVSAGNVGIRDGAIIDSGTLGDGNGGHLSFSTGNLEINDGFINSSSSGGGRDGDIYIEANKGILIVGRNTNNIYSHSDGSGSAGNITIVTDGALITNGGVIDSGTQGAGNGGAVTIQARNMMLTNGAYINTGIGSYNSNGGVDGFKDGVGRGGNISIKVEGTFFVTSGGRIYSSASTGQGDAGNISVHAGRLNISDDLSLLTSQTEKDAKGNGGNLTINVGRLNISNGGMIVADTSTPGAGGDITIKASEGILIIGQNSNIRCRTFGSGSAGSINITTGGTLAMNDGKIKSGSRGAGGGGAITVQARYLTLTNGAFISGETFGTGRGGDLIITVTDALSLSGADEFRSGLYTSTYTDRGDAGDISVSAGRLNINDGTITADTFSPGQGG